MPRKNHRISSGPFSLARNLSLSLPFDPQMTVSDHRITNVTNQYQQLRTRLLAEAGYFGAVRGRRDILVNCPTLYAVKTKGKPSRTCRRYSFCPFCWARLIAGECYLRFERTLFGDNRVTRGESERRSTTNEEYDLFEFSEEYWVDGTAESVVWDEHLELTYHREHFKHALGVFYLTTVEPTQFRWRLKQRLLAIVSSEASSFPAGTEYTSIRHRWQNPDRMMIARAVGRTCAYPLGLLQGPSEKSVELLTTRSSTRGRVPRLSTYHGGLRGRIRNRPGA